MQRWRIHQSAWMTLVNKGPGDAAHDWLGCMMTRRGVRRAGFLALVAAVMVTTGWAQVNSAEGGSACQTAPPAAPGPGGVRVELVWEDGVATAILRDSTTSRDLPDRLPMRVRFESSFGQAIVAEVPGGFTSAGTPDSCGFTIGEIVYSPADDKIGVFHSGDPTELSLPGVVRLGIVTNELDALTGIGGPVPVTIRNAP